MRDESSLAVQNCKEKSKMALGWEEMRKARDEKDDFCCGKSRTRLLL